MTKIVFTSAFDALAFDNTFFHKSDQLNQRLMRCKDRVRHIYPKNVYQLHETLFEKLEGFSLPVAQNNKLFNKLEVFDFE